MAARLLEQDQSGARLRDKPLPLSPGPRSWEGMVDDLQVPDEPTKTELDAIRSQAAALSLPLLEHDIVQLAISMRRMAAAVEPLLPRSDAFAPDPTLFDPRR